MITINGINYVDLVRTRAIEGKTINGKLVKSTLIEKPLSLFQKILLFMGLPLHGKVFYFWCPYKSILSNANYGTLGKKSRGRYSKLWYVLDPANAPELVRDLLKTGLLSPAIIAKHLHPTRVTNKRLKDHLDMYLPK